MLVATFGPTTGWLGKTITRDGDVFVLEGHGPITASDVMEYDRQGHLLWPNDGMRAWVAARAGSAQAPTVAASGPSGPLMTDPRRTAALNRPVATTKKSMSPAQIVVISVVVGCIAVFAGCAALIGVGASSAGSSSGSSSGSHYTPKPSATWTLVNTYSGADSVNTQPFTLQGGEQKLVYQASPSDSNTDPSMVEANWYVVPAGTDLNKTGGFPDATLDQAGSNSTILYKDSGSYYVSASTANCSWQFQVWEMR
jgi:hypothetical protein